MEEELQKIWNVKVKVIPLVVGSLGAIPKQFGNRLKQIGIAAGPVQVQETVLLGTARILRKVLEICGYWLWLDFNSIFQYSFTVCYLNITIIIMMIIIIILIIRPRDQE